MAYLQDYRDFSFGIYEKALPESLSWEERLKQTKEAGFDFVEISIDVEDQRLARLDWDFDQKRKLMDAMWKTGIPIKTMCLSGLARYPLGSSHEELRTKAVEVVRKAILFAADMGIRTVQLAGYDSLNEEESTPETVANFDANLEQAVLFGANRGIHLAVENIGYTHMNSLETIMKYVRRYNTPYFSSYADIGNLHAENFDLYEQFACAKGHISAVHVKDARYQETRRVPFGEGTVDFLEAFRVIRDQNYIGPFVVEMWADDRPDAFETVKHAKEFILEKIKTVWEEKNDA